MTGWSCSRQRRIAVIFVLRQHRPYLPSHLVGQRDPDQHFWLRCKLAPDPALSRHHVARAAHESRHCADDQETSDVGLAGLGYPPQPGFATGRVLTRHQPQPSRKIPAGFELFNVGGEGLNRQRRQGPDARHRLKAPRGIGLGCECLQGLGLRLNPCGLFRNLRQQVLALRDDKGG